MRPASLPLLVLLAPPVLPAAARAVADGLPSPRAAPVVSADAAQNRGLTLAGLSCGAPLSFLPSAD